MFIFFYNNVVSSSIVNNYVLKNEDLNNKKDNTFLLFYNLVLNYSIDFNYWNKLKQWTKRKKRQFKLNHKLLLFYIYKFNIVSSNNILDKIILKKNFTNFFSNELPFFIYSLGIKYKQYRLINFKTILKTKEKKIFYSKIYRPYSGYYVPYFFQIKRYKYKWLLYKNTINSLYPNKLSKTLNKKVLSIFSKKKLFFLRNFSGKSKILYPTLALEPILDNFFK